MSLATLANIEKTFGKRTIFDQLNLNVETGERLGFIGSNGSGKSTLFKVLMDEMPVDAGVVAIAKGAKVGHLVQDPKFDPTNTVVDEAELAFAELHRLSHLMRDLEHEMAHLTGDELDKILHKYQEVQHDFDLAGGYVWQHKLEATLLGVGLGRETWEQNVTTLSGGQRSRLALAKLLLDEPDLLLLDEPTNHLDLAAIEWLEKYLLQVKASVVLISHDRYLLDKLATRVVWLTQCRLKSYPGNYTAFVAQREMQELSQQRAYEEQRADIEKQKEFIRRFGAGQRSKEAKGREKRLDRLLKSDQVVEAVQKNTAIGLNFSADRRAGDQVLGVEKLCKGFDSKQLWLNVNFNLRRGDRVGVIGPNGSGKTTLLATLLGKSDADSGEIRWGANLRIGYYDQRLDDFDPDKTVLDTAWEGHDVKEQQVRDTLGIMLFRGDDVLRPVGLLSGGERARVRLSQLLLDQPNVLILDEPTNHLDIPSREALEGALRSYDGTIICVSHDRYFLEQVATRLIVLQPPNAIDFTGTYSDWVRKQNEPSEAPSQKKQNQKQERKPEKQPQQQQQKPADKPKKDNPYARPFGRLSTKELELQITETEVEIADTQQKLGNAQVVRDAAKKKQIDADFKTLSKKLKDLEAEYLERGN